MSNEADVSDRSSTGAGSGSSSAELRQDLVSGTYVLVNPARSGRPFTVSRRTESATAPAAREHARDADCPFCWGNEHSTAEELVRIGPGEPNAPGWRVRVVRNRYPVVGGTDRATGRCEVVVFRRHDHRLEDMDVDELTEILAVIRDRVAAPSLAQRACVQVFVNAEAEAGASIAHPHAQLIGLDFTPPALEVEFAMLRGPRADPLRQDLELAKELELLVVDDEIAAWCPWGMAHPFGVRIASKTAGPAFADLDDVHIASVARTLRDVLGAVNDLLDRPPYNVVVFCDQSRDGCVRRWRIEVIPRINVGGGFEIGTGVTTHSTATPAAAEALRTRIRRGQPRADLQPDPPT
jgi:UDPglucose--hexose-1-phosphate uridylyltransferase